MPPLRLRMLRHAAWLVLVLPACCFLGGPSAAGESPQNAIVRAPRPPAAAVSQTPSLATPRFVLAWGK